MPDEVSRVRKVSAAAVVVILSVGVPVAGISRITALRHDAPVAIFVTIAYELTLSMISFITAVSVNLRARWVGSTADIIDSWARRQISPFTRAYLRYVMALTRYMDTRGLSTAGPHILEMSDVQVTLSLAAKPLHGLNPDPVRHHASSEENESGSIWHWLNEAHSKSSILSIIGPPGSGKSTLLRHVAFTLAKGSRKRDAQASLARIPVLVNLREYTSLQPAKTLSLADMIRRNLVALDRKEPPSWVEANLRRGKFAILLDGLDEIPDESTRIALSEWLAHQASAQDGNLFVLTSRPFGYRENPIPGAMIVEVRPLAEGQIASFIRQWYRAISVRSYAADNESSQLAAQAGATDLLARLDQTPSLFELTANPLLLTMLVNVHYYRAGALPGTRAELYDEICDVFLAKRDQVRSIRIEIPGPQKRAGLQALAYEMMKRGITEAKVADAATWMQHALIKMTRSIEPVDFIKNIENSSGLLHEKERGIYSFAHLTLQEYLAAEFIRETRRVEEIAGHVTNPWWRETVRLYAAIADATPIVNACLEYRTNPDLIVLGVQCAGEANTLDREVQREINECIDPPNAREAPHVRHVAARARLQLRVSQDTALKKSSFICSTYITWLEYQYFIDSQAGKECLVPDHWSSDIYPAGMDYEPVSGIRYSDAVKFCNWLNSELESPFVFRLPRSSEIEKNAQISTSRTTFSGPVSWTTTQLPRSRDGRFWPLLRNPSEGSRRDTSPLLNCAINKQDTIRKAVEDLDHISKGNFRTGPINECIRDLISRCWEDAHTCDVGQIEKDIGLAQRLMLDYSVHGLPDRGGALQNRLKMLADLLSETSGIAFRRENYSQRLTTEMEAHRGTARKAALEAALVCVLLYREHGGGLELPPPEKITRPTRKIPNPSRQPSVIIDILAHAFAGIYIDFTVLSSRISGSTIPVESITYVRDAQDNQEHEEIPVNDYRLNLAPIPLAKRAMDVVASGTAVVLLAPLLALIAIAIRLQDGGPVIFTQTRMGQGGRAFRMYKFRTMVIDAEKRLAEIYATGSSDGILFKMRRDPRITSFGAFLRKWSLDELPQLFNVLLGDMSLVGPRPALPAEVEKYADHVRRRLDVKPGITGLWQVNGRSDLSWEESVRLDLRYVEAWSLTLDIQIIWKTIAVILRGSGAY